MDWAESVEGCGSGEWVGGGVLFLWSWSVVVVMTVPCSIAKDIIFSYGVSEG